MKYRIKTSQLCTVTWEFEIEADSPDAALEKYYSGDHDEYLHSYVGDGIGDTTESVELAP